MGSREVRLHVDSAEGPFYRDWDPLLSVRDFVNGPLLVIAPHPDDEVIGCGGLIAAHRELGQPVFLLVMTDGALGDPSRVGDAAYTSVRREESLLAAEALGGVEVAFLDHKDGSLRQLESAPELVEHLQRVRPSTVAFPSPFELHPDHRATSLLAARALVESDFGGTMLAYEVGVLMLANVLLDITALMDRKRAALACYRSQLEHHDLLEKVGHLNATRTVNVADPNIRFAEGYLRLLPGTVEDYFATVDLLLRKTDAGRPAIP